MNIGGTVATLTMNPTLDVAYEVDRVIHTHKMRARGGSCDPGGGGLNVARVLDRLGGDTRCYYMSGGPTGAALDGLLDVLCLACQRVPIAGATRVSTSVLERESGKEFRFLASGPEVSAGEWQECLRRVGSDDCSVLVASGSLPPGVPQDFYAQLLEAGRPRGRKLVLDTSGDALRCSLEVGGVFLVKPSLGEFRLLTGCELDSEAAIGREAMRLVENARAEMVAVTMGHEGALLASRAGVMRLPALPIEAKSAVGAGDSFVAGMVYALTSGWSEADSFRFGVAAGSAAVLTPGTDLARAEDIRRLYDLVPAPS